MSHFSVIVLVPPTEDPSNGSVRESAIAKATELLAPFDENGEWFCEGSKWDWWQVGGRWTGRMTDYNPRTDPDNLESCTICGGTGTRPDAAQIEAANPGWMEWSHGCNGCEGKGVRVKWPSSFKDFDGDVLPVPRIRADFAPFAILTPKGEWHEQGEMGWFGEVADEKPEDQWHSEARQLLDAHRDCLAVLVDCHI